MDAHASNTHLVELCSSVCIRVLINCVHGCNCAGGVPLRIIPTLSMILHSKWPAARYNEISA